MDWDISRRCCAFCFGNCDELISPLHLISPVQARALSTVLNFEGQGSYVPNGGVLELKYLHATPCVSCQQWVVEAEAVIEDWENILHKIRTVKSALKQIIRDGEQLRQNGKKSCRKGAASSSISDYDCVSKTAGAAFQFPADDCLKTKKMGVPLMKEITKYVNVSMIDVKESLLSDSNLSDGDHNAHDAGWITEENTLVHPESESKVHCIFPGRLTQDQHTGLRQQNEGYKVKLRSTQRDHVGTHVPQIHHQSPAAANNFEPTRCWKTHQPKTLNENEEDSSTYSHETVGGTVKLKYLRIQLIPCDHAAFARCHENKAGKVVVRQSPKNSSRMATIKRLRRRARRWKTATVAVSPKKPIGRPRKFKILEGKLESCLAPRCKFSSTDPDELAGHYREMHLKDPRPYKCREPNCDRNFREFRRLVIHRNAHGGLFSYMCQHCSKGFQRSESLRDHILLFHTENAPLHSCHLCARSFRLERKLKNHLKYFHNPPQCRCTIEGCTYVSRNFSNLRNHRIRHHSDKYPNLKKAKRKEREVCSECGMTFVSNFLFRRHQLSHEGIPAEVLKPYTCSYEECKYRSSLKSQVKKHIHLVHETTGKQFKCTEPGCSAMFKQRSGMRTHIQRIHAPPSEKHKLWPCDFCDLKLSSSKSLKDHIAIKHTEGNRQDFSCARCNRGFPTQKYLRRHEVTYPNCKPIEIGPTSVLCELCNKYCSNLAGLKRHNRLVHSDLRPWKCGRCDKTFPIKMYLMRHQRDSKSCFPREEAVSTTSSFQEHIALEEQVVEPMSSDADIQLEAGPEPSTRITRDNCEEGRRKQHISNRKSDVKIALKSRRELALQRIRITKESKADANRTEIQIPMNVDVQSQMQQDFYFAFYGYEQPTTE